MLLTYYLLAITIILALTWRHRTVLYFCIAIICLTALYQGVMSGLGAGFLGLLIVLAFCYFNHTFKNPKVQTLLLGTMAALLWCLIMHYLPGFNNQKVINNILLANARHPFSMYLNFDKVMAGLIIYTFSPLITAPATIGWQQLRQTLWVLASILLVILGPAVLSGYVRFDPKIPDILPIWAMNNFLFVCFGEEVLFRGFLQDTIKSYLPPRRAFVFLAISIASIIFGLEHDKSGVLYMGLAAFCGLFYGYAYESTRRLVCAMLVHFFLNLSHLLLFTYPA